MNIKIKKLHPDAVIPKYAHVGDGGMDLVVTSITRQKDAFTGYVEYGTGLAVEIPEGYVGLVFPRSSISKTAMFMANSVGVIDSHYRGEIMVRLKVDSNSIMVDKAVEEDVDLTEDYKNFLRNYEPISYDVGDKIAQIMIIPRPEITFDEVDELSDTVRGIGGFGSTGKQ